MRTLKKTLCLVLALVMVLGLGAFSVSAVDAEDFSDLDEVSAEYREAVELLAALDVLRGQDNGEDGLEVAPDKTLKREEAVTYIARLLNGSDNFVIVDSTFTDIPAGHWCQPYVAYLQTNGVIKGDGGELFGFGQELTGAQWGMMLIRALGYQDEKEGITMDNWQLKVASYARSLGLDTGLVEALNVNADIDRETTLQMAYNALTSPCVDYNAQGGVLEQVKVGTKYLANNFGLNVDAGADDFAQGTFSDTVSGVIVENSAIADVETTTLNDAAATELDYDTGTDMLGHYVTVYYANGKILKVIDQSKVVVVEDKKDVDTADEFKAAFGDTFAKIQSTAPSGTDGATFDKDGNYAGGDIKGDDFSANDSVTEGTYILYDGAVVSYLAFPDYDVTNVQVTVKNAEKGYYIVGEDNNNTEDQYVKISAADDDNFVISDEEIDWLGYVEELKDNETANVVYLVADYGAKFLVKAPETVEGQVTKINTTESKIYIGEDEYEYNTSSDGTVDGAIGEGYVKSDEVKVGETYTFYLDNDGQIFAAAGEVKAEPKAEYELIYVIGKAKQDGAKDEYGKAADKYNLQYYKLDGSINLTTIDKVCNTNDHKAATDVTDAAWAWITGAGWALIGTDSKGVVTVVYLTAGSACDIEGYEYTASTGVNPGGNIDTSKATTIVDSDTLLNSKTVYLYRTDSENITTGAASSKFKAAVAKVGAHTGTIASTATPDIVTLENESNSNKADVVAIWVGAGLNGEETSSDVYYVAAYNGQVSAEDTKKGTIDTYEYAVYDAKGAASTIVTKDAEEDGFVGEFVKVTTDTKGYNSFESVTADLLAEDSDNKTLVREFNNIDSDDSFISDDITYLTVDGETYDVTDAVVVDLRTDVEAEDKVDSVKKFIPETASTKNELTALAIAAKGKVSVILVTGAYAELTLTVDGTAVSGDNVTPSIKAVSNYDGNNKIASGKSATVTITLSYTSNFKDATHDVAFTVTGATAVTSSPITSAETNSADKFEIEIELVNIVGSSDTVTITISSVGDIT